MHKTLSKFTKNHPLQFIKTLFIECQCEQGMGPYYDMARTYTKPSDCINRHVDGYFKTFPKSQKVQVKIIFFCLSGP